MERNIEARSRHHCHRGKTMCIKNSVCVSAALGSQHAMRMRRIILPSLVCAAVPYFPTLSHKRHDSRGKKITEHKSVLSFSASFV